MTKVSTTSDVIYITFIFTCEDIMFLQREIFVTNLLFIITWGKFSMFQNRGFVCFRRRRSHTNLQGWIPCGYPCVHPEIENLAHSIMVLSMTFFPRERKAHRREESLRVRPAHQVPSCELPIFVKNLTSPTNSNWFWKLGKGAYPLESTCTSD